MKKYIPIMFLVITNYVSAGGLVTQDGYGGYYQNGKHYLSDMNGGYYTPGGGHAISDGGGGLYAPGGNRYIQSTPNYNRY